MTDLPPDDQAPDRAPVWSDTPTTECLVCGATFETSAQTIVHISVDHYGNEPQAFRLAIASAKHGIALTDTGTMPLLAISMLLGYDGCACGCGAGPGYQMVTIHAVAEQWRALAEAVMQQTTPEAAAAALADYMASLDAEEGPPDV